MSSVAQFQTIEASAQYRSKAKKARELAETAAAQDARQVLLHDALLWDRMADYEEQSAERQADGGAALEDESEQMARYGITRVCVDSFHFREFRYTRFVDALAEAKRHVEQTLPKRTARYLFVRRG